VTTGLFALPLAFAIGAAAGARLLAGRRVRVAVDLAKGPDDPEAFVRALASRSHSKTVADSLHGRKSVENY